MEHIFFIVFVAVGAFLVGSGIPLLRGRVPPNALYGFRTQATLSNTDLWYRVNRVLGKWLIAIGLLILLASFLPYLTAPAVAAGSLVAILFAGILAASIHGMRLTRQIPT